MIRSFEKFLVFTLLGMELNTDLVNIFYSSMEAFVEASVE